MKKFIALLFLLPAIIFAQGYDRSGPRPKLSVSGLVIDSLSNEPLSFAALSFISPQDNQLITGGIFNDEGRFIIEDVPVGVYKLLVEYMGYVPKIIPEVKVRPNKNSNDNNTQSPYSAMNAVIDIGVFNMIKSVNQLEEIELVEEKPFVVQGIDRKIFNVDQDLTSSGSTAIELMEKLPSVEVDIDGNLSLRGSTQVRLYVDGKPSMLSSSDLLGTLPSSMIESIELITNPSAKYSPEGMAGIINVVLKKNNKVGFNGNTSFTVGYPARNNFTGLLNCRSDKLNLFASYSIMDRIGGFDSESEKHTYFAEDTFDLSIDIVLPPSVIETLLFILINLIGVDEDFIPADKIFSTNILADPSRMGNSCEFNSTIKLSIPKPYNAPIKCSTVETFVPCSFDKVVHKVVSITFSNVGITILLLFKSILLKRIPVFGWAGKRFISTRFPVCKPSPPIEIFLLIVFWFKIDM